MNKYSVYEIVTKIIGRIDAIGEFYTDRERYRNLEELCGLVSDLLGDIYGEANNIKRYEASVKSSGLFAYEFLKDLKEELDDVLEMLERSEEE